MTSEHQSEEGMKVCPHKRSEAHYDHFRCADCGWYKPDWTGKRGTGAGDDEWFPSADAFLRFRHTGERPWLSRPTPVDVGDEELIRELRTEANFVDWTETEMKDLLRRAADRLGALAGGK